MTRAGGVVLGSVMALIGTMRYRLPAIVDEMEAYGADVADAVIRTGDLRQTPAQAHRCRMLRWREIAEMIGRLPYRLLAASASNAMSMTDSPALDRLAADPEWWRGSSTGRRN